jgi:hypothetical protein
MKASSPVNAAMQSQLVIMEHFLHDMLDNVREAQERLDAGERNGAVGALLSGSQSFDHLRTLYDAILVMHRNSAMIERTRE